MLTEKGIIKIVPVNKNMRYAVKVDKYLKAAQKEGIELWNYEKKQKERIFKENSNYFQSLKIYLYKKGLYLIPKELGNQYFAVQKEFGGKELLDGISACSNLFPYEISKTPYSKLNDWERHYYRKWYPVIYHKSQYTSLQNTDNSQPSGKWKKTDCEPAVYVYR